MSEQHRTGVGYYVAAALLIALLVTAVGLVVAMAMRPAAAPPQAVVATGRAAIDCEVPSQGVTCFDTLVTNTGGSDGIVACGLDPAEGTDATFATGGTTQRFPLGSSESVHLVTQVTTTGASSAAAPHMLCNAEPS